MLAPAAFFAAAAAPQLRGAANATGAALRATAAPPAPVYLCSDGACAPVAPGTPGSASEEVCRRTCPQQGGNGAAGEYDPYGNGTMASCAAPQPGTCTWYAGCMEARHPCGAGGYALSYGEVYCARFVAAFAGAGGKIEAWMWATLACLQREAARMLAGAGNMTCDAMRHGAFQTHPKCYTDNGAQSICSLNLLLDWPRIIEVIQIKDLLSADGLKQMVSTLADCL